MFGRNSPKNARTPKTKAGCTPTAHNKMPVEALVITPLIATPRAPCRHLVHHSNKSAPGFRDGASGISAR